MWHLALGMRAPLELLAEAHLRVNKAKEGEAVERCVPLLSSDGHIVGHAAVTVVLSSLGAIEPRPHAERCSRRDAGEVQFAFDAVHPEWSDVIVINETGRFETFSSGDLGSWSVQAHVLTLAWDCWEPEFLRMSDNGKNFRGSYGFSLTNQDPPDWFLYFFQDAPFISNSDKDLDVGLEFFGRASGRLR
mmetsp:Transcript_70525/g.178754  ORF Transcript_70525/g.178754 Transcript_70525/m.178754 type:complete len:189 (+) Transcript_70525:661-1227(+)